MASSSKKRGGPIVRFEPEGASFLDAYPSCRVIFKARGWYDYCRGLSGHYPVVSKDFAEFFMGRRKYLR